MSTPITAERARTLLYDLASALIQAGLHATAMSTAESSPARTTTPYPVA
jgi:hypothetical protein